MRKYGESKTTRIMMATVPHVTSGLGLRKFQTDGFLLTRVYHLQDSNPLFCNSYLTSVGLFFLLAQQPPVGQDLLIHEVSRSQTTTRPSRQDSSGRVIGLSQRPLPDNTTHNRQTYFPPSGIRTQNLTRRVAVDLCLRPLWPAALELGKKKNSLANKDQNFLSTT